MPLTTSQITGRVVLPDDTAFTDGVLTFTLSEADTELAQVIAPAGYRITLDGDELPTGAVLWRNTEGSRGSSYSVTLRATVTTDLGGGETLTTRKTYALGSVQVGDAASYSIGELLLNPVPVTSSWNLNIQDPEAGRASLGLVIGEDVAAYVGGVDNDFMQRKSGAWTYRTPEQVAADLTIASTRVAMSGGGTAQDYAGFATRAAFVAWASGKTPATGSVIHAAGRAYRYIGSGTTISDLPGWVLENRGPVTFATTTDLQSEIATNGSIYDIGTQFISGVTVYEKSAFGWVPQITVDDLQAQIAQKLPDAENSVDNTRLANMPASTIKGNSGIIAADPVDMTVEQTNKLLGWKYSGIYTSGGVDLPPSTVSPNAPTGLRCGSIVTAASGFTSVVFSAPLASGPIVTVTPVGGTSGDDLSVKITNRSITGFDVQVTKNTVGVVTIVSTTICYIAMGDA